jgi:hypothetical protein
MQLDVMMLRYTRTAVTLLRADDGAIMLQNYASTAFFGECLAAITGRCLSATPEWGCQ